MIFASTNILVCYKFIIQILPFFSLVFEYFFPSTVMNWINLLNSWAIVIRVYMTFDRNRASSSREHDNNFVLTQTHRQQYPYDGPYNPLLDLCNSSRIKYNIMMCVMCQCVYIIYRKYRIYYYYIIIIILLEYGLWTRLSITYVVCAAVYRHV